MRGDKSWPHRDQVLYKIARGESDFEGIPTPRVSETLKRVFRKGKISRTAMIDIYVTDKMRQGTSVDDIISDCERRFGSFFSDRKGEALNWAVRIIKALCALGELKGTELCALKRRRSSLRQNRVLVDNPDERCKEREAKVLDFIRQWHPQPEFRVEDRTQGIQVGSDFRVFYGATNEHVASYDAKSSKVITRAQRDEAFRLLKKGVPYWIVFENGDKVLINKDLKFTPTAYQISQKKCLTSPNLFDTFSLGGDMQ